jgi:hypothetical protein
MATDVTGALKQVVADGIGIARRFAKALAEQSGKAHCWLRTLRFRVGSAGNG